MQVRDSAPRNLWHVLARAQGLTVFRVLASPGFPVYDYDLPSLRQALSASVADVNSQSLSPYLFRAFRSTIKRVSAQACSPRLSLLLSGFFCRCAGYTFFFYFFQFKMVTANHLFQPFPIVS